MKQLIAMFAAVIFSANLQVGAQEPIPAPRPEPSEVADEVAQEATDDLGDQELDDLEMEDAIPLQPTPEPSVIEDNPIMILQSEAERSRVERATFDAPLEGTIVEGPIVDGPTFPNESIPMEPRLDPIPAGAVGGRAYPSAPPVTGRVIQSPQTIARPVVTSREVIQSAPPTNVTPGYTYRGSEIIYSSPPTPGRVVTSPPVRVTCPPASRYPANSPVQVRPTSPPPQAVRVYSNQVPRQSAPSRYVVVQQSGTTTRYAPNSVRYVIPNAQPTRPVPQPARRYVVVSQPVQYRPAVQQQVRVVPVTVSNAPRTVTIISGPPDAAIVPRYVPGQPIRNAIRGAAWP